MKTRDKKEKNSSPIRKSSDISKNPDKRIDQDFKGHPHGVAKKEIINPKNSTQRKTAAVDKKDGEKMLSGPASKKKQVDEQNSDGSAGAFGATENVND